MRGAKVFYYEVGIECKNNKTRKIISQSSVQIEGQTPMDKATATSLLTQYANEDRVTELKQLLADTDYVVCKIAEGAATFDEYAAVIAKRQEWRDEINQLESGEQS